jgi:hypothetical protein
MLLPYHIVTIMQIENKSWTIKGKKFEGVIAWPDDLNEALTLLSEREVFEAFKIGYLEICRRQICGLTRRRRSQKIDLSALSPEHQALILDVFHDLASQNRQYQPAQKNVQPLEQRITPIDSVETPEEASAPDHPHVSEFDQDFAKYLASLGSLPQPHTETASQQTETAEYQPQSHQKGLLSRLFG